MDAPMGKLNKTVSMLKNHRPTSTLHPSSTGIMCIYATSVGEEGWGLILIAAFNRSWLTTQLVN